MPFANQHAARLVEPSSFIARSFRRKNIALGIDLILGKRKKGGSMETQAIRFAKDRFTEKEARNWLKEHDYSPILFEPAKEEEVAKGLRIMSFRPVSAEEFSKRIAPRGIAVGPKGGRYRVGSERTDPKGRKTRSYVGNKPAGGDEDKVREDGGQYSRWAEHVRVRGGRDARLPTAGTEITRHYRGQEVKVVEGPEGFTVHIDGKHVATGRSLTGALSRAMGKGVSGYSFMRLGGAQDADAGKRDWKATERAKGKIAAWTKERTGEGAKVVVEHTRDGVRAHVHHGGEHYIIEGDAAGAARGSYRQNGAKWEPHGTEYGKKETSRVVHKSPTEELRERHGFDKPGPSKIPDANKNRLHEEADNLNEAARKTFHAEGRLRSNRDTIDSALYDLKAEVHRAVADGHDPKEVAAKYGKEAEERAKAYNDNQQKLNPKKTWTTGMAGYMGPQEARRQIEATAANAEAMAKPGGEWIGRQKPSDESLTTMRTAGGERKGFKIPEPQKAEPKADGGKTGDKTGTIEDTDKGVVYHTEFGPLSASSAAGHSVIRTWEKRPAHERTRDEWNARREYHLNAIDTLQRGFHESPNRPAKGQGYGLDVRESGKEHAAHLIAMGGWGDPNGHRKAVEAALKAGETVPPSVLADYPDLAKLTKPAPAASGGEGKGAYPEGHPGAIPSEMNEHGIPHPFTTKKNLRANYSNKLSRYLRKEHGIPETHVSADGTTVFVSDNRVQMKVIHEADGLKLAVSRGPGTYLITRTVGHGESADAPKIIADEFNRLRAASDEQDRAIIKARKEEEDAAKARAEATAKARANKTENDRRKTNLKTLREQIKAGKHETLGKEHGERIDRIHKMVSAAQKHADSIAQFGVKDTEVHVHPDAVRLTDKDGNEYARIGHDVDHEAIMPHLRETLPVGVHVHDEPAPESTSKSLGEWTYRDADSLMLKSLFADSEAPAIPDGYAAVLYDPSERQWTAHRELDTDDLEV